MEKRLIQTSKFLSLVLRHKPEKIGIKLNASGWTSIAELIRLANKANFRMTETEVLDVVRENDKKRFVISDDGLRIRASQGHSIAVNLGLLEVEPPEVLYHGTVSRNIEPIRLNGIVKRKRQHVHLSRDRETAIRVGNRRGKAIILIVDAKEMYYKGMTFYLSDNNVWLTDHVPEAFIGFPEVLSK